VKVSVLAERLQAFASQRLDLNRDDLKGAIRNALRRGIDPLHQKVAGRGQRHFFETKQLVRSGPESARDANERCKIWFSVSADVVRITPFTEAAAARSLCVGNTQFLRPVLQVPTKCIHENVLFWIILLRHELNGGICKPKTFLRWHR
jgi:hypothetical protein